MLYDQLLFSELRLVSVSMNAVVAGIDVDGEGASA